MREKIGINDSSRFSQFKYELKKDSSHKRAGDEWIMPEVRWFPHCGTCAGLPQSNFWNEMYQLWVVPLEC